MPRPGRPRLRESDLPPGVRDRLAARRAESETPEFQTQHAEEVARLQQEFPPLQPDERLLEVLATLRLERERLGLTLDDVAEHSGIDPTTICKLENGRLLNPTYSTMRAYARALGKQLGWVLGDMQEEPDFSEAELAAADRAWERIAAERLDQERPA